MRKSTHPQATLVITTNLPLAHRLKWTYCLPHPHSLNKKKKEKEKEKKVKKEKKEKKENGDWNGVAEGKEMSPETGGDPGKERQILADLASLCHGKEAKGQQCCEHVRHKAQSSRVLGWDGAAGCGRGAIG